MTKKQKQKRNRTKTKKKKTGHVVDQKSKTNSLCFQDVMHEWKQQLQQNKNNNKNDDDMDDYDDGSNDVANVFFELANASAVSYRLPHRKNNNTKHNNDNNDDGDDDSQSEDEDDDDVMTTTTATTTTSSSTMITIQQDIGACGKHTGGIVWETAYLLLEYLRATNHNCSTFLEVGAGCGLVGLGVYKLNIATKKVYLTETSDVMPNLLANVEQNTTTTTTTTSTASSSGSSNTIQDDDDDNSAVEKKKSKKNKKRRRHDREDNSTSIAISTIQKGSPHLYTCQLDWTRFEQDCQEANILPHSIDTIVGTDVVFSTELVIPLLKTIRYLAHSKSTIVLCLQERCKDSHRLLLDSAHEHELMVEDISDHVVTNVPECAWGKDLECKLLKLSIIASTTTSTSLSHSKKSKDVKKRKNR